MRFGEYITEGKSKPIGIFIGRMSPPTIAHSKIINDAIQKYSQVYVIIIEGEATSKLEKNFLSFLDRTEVLKITNPRSKPILARKGYIPDIIEDNKIATSDGIVIIAGSDRINGYKSQFKNVDYNVKFEEIKRTESDVSASKVRQALIDDDFKTYSRMVAPGLDNKKWFDLMKRALNVKSGELMESGRFLQYLNEGGNAIKESVPINQKNAKATLDNIFKKVLPLFNITEEDTLVGGSILKKLTPSGDIDLLISVPSLIRNNEDVNDMDDIYKFIVNQVKKVASYSIVSKGIGVISIPFPIANIDGEQEGQIVQLDLMFTDDLNWSKFAYHAPYYYESKWKSVYRFILLTSCIKYATMNITKRDVGGNPVEWSKVLINKDKGLMLVKQMIDQKGKTKEIDRKFFSFNPDEVVKLFGEGITENDLISFESILNVIQGKQYPFKDKVDDILKETANGFKKMGFVVPVELEKYL